MEVSSATEVHQVRVCVVYTVPHLPDSVLHAAFANMAPAGVHQAIRKVQLVTCCGHVAQSSLIPDMYRAQHVQWLAGLPAILSLLIAAGVAVGRLQSCV